MYWDAVCLDLAEQICAEKRLSPSSTSVDTPAQSEPGSEVSMASD